MIDLGPIGRDRVYWATLAHRAMIRDGRWRTTDPGVLLRIAVCIGAAVSDDLGRDYAEEIQEGLCADWTIKRKRSLLDWLTWWLP